MMSARSSLATAQQTIAGIRAQSSAQVAKVGIATKAATATAAEHKALAGQLAGPRPGTTMTWAIDAGRKIAGEAL